MRFMVFGDRSEMQKRPECQGEEQERLSLNAPCSLQAAPARRNVPMPSCHPREIFLSNVAAFVIVCMV
ncbi:MAG: hypothetical protein HEQ37_04055 [Acidovorax sp.]|nr:hypothetical protein [Acidovorax sp.]